MTIEREEFFETSGQSFQVRFEIEATQVREGIGDYEFWGQRGHQAEKVWKFSVSDILWADLNGAEVKDKSVLKSLRVAAEEWAEDNHDKLLDIVS